MPAKKGNKYALGNKGGRPTKFTPELIDLAKNYLANCKDEFKGKGKSVVSLPQVAGLARWLGVSRETVYAWKNENKEFSDTIDDILAEQQKRLIENGLAGNYNPIITKLVLSANHGMREKTDVTTNDKDIPAPILDGLSNVPANNGNQENSGAN